MTENPQNDTRRTEAAQLKRLFIDWQKKRKAAGEPHSQDNVAWLFGMGQSALSQYLNGEIPLNIGAAVTFARTFGVLVDQFSPTIAQQIRDAVTVTRGPQASGSASPPKWMDGDAFRLLDYYYGLDDRARAEVMDTAVELAGRDAGAAANKG